MDDRYLLLFSLGIAGIIKLKGLFFWGCAWRRVASENPMEKIRVLLADDHVVVREGTRELLEREPDIEVIGEANDGEEAVRLAKELTPDVAVLDIAMPKLNGIEATKQIREAHPSIAVLVLTAYDNDQYVFAILEAGAAGYLLKNVAGRQLIDAIRQVRAGQAVLHPIVARKVVDRFTRSGHRSSWNGPAAELTERELEVLKLAARGRSNKEIAAELFLSARTVQHHLTSIFTKLGVSSRTEAVLHALRMGWITMDDAW